jgi:two-component system, OmpR family, response regulator PrrA
LLGELAGPVCSDEGVSMAGPQPMVLVVDDDAWIRDVLQTGLRRHGFAVQLADTGRQALALCQRDQGVTVVLVDKRLQEMEGQQLVAALRKLNPQIQCCLMSGDNDSYAEEEVVGFGLVPVIPKPFRIPEVAQTLRQLLGQAAPGDA